MKSTTFWTSAFAASSLVSAIELAPRSDNPRVLGLDIERRHVPDVIAREKARMHRRQNTVEQVLDNQDTLYFANITLGTPSQNLRVHIDTGSSDLWVNLANSTYCQSQYDPCDGGTYSPDSSSTYKYVSDEFNVTYADGSSAGGDYVSDTIGFGGVTLDNFQFGLGEISTSSQGVLGIGYPLNEAQVQSVNDRPYPNLPVALVDGGHINRNVYSLWLNDLDASTGTILFGGVNTAKYQGELRTLPIIPISGDFYHFVIVMTSFSFNGSAVTSANLPDRVLLDSGASLTYLPVDIVRAVWRAAGASYNQRDGLAYADCSMANTNSFLEFGFNGVKIQVPFNELLLDSYDDNGNPLLFQNGRRACVFGLLPATAGISILGDTFLRSAYVVYDIANNQLSLAQTVFNATANDVREIASGTARVPGASPAPSSVTSVAAGTATGTARIGTQTTTLTGLAGGGQAGGSSPTGSSSRSSSSNLARATQMPYVAGAAALMAGLGLIV